jgi:hypothetical protein
MILRERIKICIGNFKIKVEVAIKEKKKLNDEYLKQTREDNLVWNNIKLMNNSELLMNIMNRKNYCEIITSLQEGSRKLEDFDFENKESFKYLKFHIKSESNKREQDDTNKIEEYICLIKNRNKKSIEFEKKLNMKRLICQRNKKRIL